MKVTNEVAQSIVIHHFGKPPKAIEQLSGGFANFVYKATVDKESYIIRVSDDPVKMQFFIKEQWAVQKAHEYKVPVPKILEVANSVEEYPNFPYMITEFVEGEPAMNSPSTARAEIIRELAKYTAIINSIPTSGYGHVFDWSNNQLSRNETWTEFLDKEFEVDERLAVFEKHNILDEDIVARLKSGIKEIRSWNYKPSLNHGDIRLKNVILNEKGRIKAILDWEFCVSLIAPQWDLSIALHDLTIDEKDVFLMGYGLTPKEYRNRSRGMKVINILNYSNWIEHAYEEKDERKRRDRIEYMKTRLRGCFDLYSL